MSSSRGPAVVLPFLVAFAVSLVISGAAGAATWCVHQPADCAGTDASAVQDALDAAAAAPGRDTIEVGPHAGATPETLHVVAGNAVDLVGVEDAALLLGGGSGAPVSLAEPSAVVSGLTLVSAGAPSTFVDAQAGTLDGVEVRTTGAAVAVHLGAAVLHHALVRGPATAVLADGAGGRIENSVIAGDRAVDSSGTGLAISDTEALALSTVLRVTGGDVTVDGAYFLPWDDEEATTDPLVDVAPASAAVVTLRSTTVDGRFTPGSGLRASCSGGATADVTLVDVLAVHRATDLVRGGAGCAVHLDHVEYGARDAGGGSFVDGAGVVAAGDDWFGDGGDFLRPLWTSPARDGGSARPAAAGETDIMGQPRVVDGVRDIGAVEYQHQAPSAAIGGLPATINAGDDLWIDAGADDPDGEWLTASWTVDGVTAPKWDFPDGADLDTLRPPALGVFYGSLLWRPAAPGTHRIVLTETDPSGLSATDARVVRVGGTATTDTTTTPPPPITFLPPKPSTPVFPHVVLKPLMLVGPGGRKLTPGGRLAVQVTCGLPKTCAGSVRLVLPGLRKQDKARDIGRVSFKLSAFKGKTYKITLSRSGAKAIRASKIGRAVTVVAYRGSGKRAKRWVSEHWVVTA